jgi:hypothetical protein
MSFNHDVVVIGAGGAPPPVLRLLEEGRSKPPSLLDAMMNSSAESFVMAHHGDETPLRVEPMKAVPELPLPGRGEDR